MKRCILILIMLFLLIPIVAGDSLEVLKNFLLNDGKVAFSGIEVSILYDKPDFPNISIYKVFSNGKLNIRKEYLSPPSLFGRIIVDNGKYQYDFDPEKRMVMISPTQFFGANKEEIDKRWELVKKNFLINSEREEIFLGRKTHVILVISKYTKKPVLRMWIDGEEYLPLRKDKFNSDGNLIGKTMFMEINFDAKISDSFFELEFLKDRNIKIEEMRLKEEKKPKKIDAPVNLPLGYTLAKIYIVLEERNITYYYKYTDGLNDLSLFVSDYPFRFPGKPTEIGDFEVLYDANILWKSVSWRDGNKFYLLIGDVPYSSLKTFIETTIRNRTS
ncbi:MAG: sigma-E factor regulatory protein RseB domain-containing protein [Dictyoglomaceae bacterium]|nr:sigma-E factor regulatory protein RseB domain-containing protein [Dictyoglomaceae bacterium]